MRRARLKETGQRAYYHVMSRVIERRRLLGRREKEALRSYLRKYAAFSGVAVLTYAILDNHFHVLVEVPEPEVLDDAALLSRLGHIYDAETVRAVGDELAWLRSEGQREAAECLRGRYLARMHDISAFMKGLKQCFTQWYNRRHERRGTLWEDRFRSVLVEPGDSGGSSHTLLTMAAYVDLNAMRAGLVKDPRAYRYSGYGEACGGGEVARRGLSRLFELYGQGRMAWDALQESYRRQLYVEGEASECRPGFTREAVEAVLAAGGRLSPGQLLHCRVRYFSDGVVLGSQAYVESVFERYRDRFGAKRRSGARSLRGVEGLGLFTLRDLRLDPIGLPAR